MIELILQQQLGVVNAEENLETSDKIFNVLLFVRLSFLRLQNFTLLVRQHQLVISGLFLFYF